MVELQEQTNPERNNYHNGFIYHILVSDGSILWIEIECLSVFAALVHLQVWFCCKYHL